MTIGLERDLSEIKKKAFISQLSDIITQVKLFLILGSSNGTYLNLFTVIYARSMYL